MISSPLPTGYNFTKKKVKKWNKSVTRLIFYLLYLFVQSARDSFVSLKWKCTRPVLWWTALINIQNGTWNNATRETVGISYHSTSAALRRRYIHSTQDFILRRVSRILKAPFYLLEVHVQKVNCSSIRMACNWKQWVAKISITIETLKPLFRHYNLDVFEWEYMRFKRMVIS